jgi:hypothetical protein
VATPCVITGGCLVLLAFNVKETNTGSVGFSLLHIKLNLSFVVAQELGQDQVKFYSFTKLMFNLSSYLVDAST